MCRKKNINFAAYRASETHNQRKNIYDHNKDMALRQCRFYFLRIKDNEYILEKIIC